MPGGTKPLPEPVLTFRQMFCGIHLRAISQDVLMNLILNIYLEIALLKLLPHLSWANELIPKYGLICDDF